MSAGQGVSSGPKPNRAIRRVVVSILEIETQLSAYELSPRGPTLAPMQTALNLLGFADSPFMQTYGAKRVVVVAGTNGKGSTAATLATLLSEAGERVGILTSPHLMSVTERFRIGEIDISEPLFIEAFERVFPRVKHLPLTRFEILTLIALELFARDTLTPMVDWIVLEVGVGGRFDATNAVPHDWVIVTRLGFDHVRLLGNTLEQIAWNKFGVVSVGCTVVHAPLPETVLPLKRDIELSTQSRWVESAKGEVHVQAARIPQFRMESPWGTARLALPGVRGLENTLLALTMFQELGFSPSQYVHAISRVRWPGRMELVSEEPCPLFLSGDHNEQGIQSLVDILKLHVYKRIHLIVGVGSEKDLESILSPLLQLPRAHVYLTETPFKGRSISSYGLWLKKVQLAEADPFQLLEKVQALAETDDLIVVTGSLYLVGDIRKYVLQPKSR